MFPQDGGCGCGGIAVTGLSNSTNEKIGGTINRENMGGGRFVVPGGLVCKPNANEYSNDDRTSDHCIPSTHAISDARFDQLLKRVSEPFPMVLTTALNVISKPIKGISSRKEHDRTKTTKKMHH